MHSQGQRHTPPARNLVLAGIALAGIFLGFLILALFLLFPTSAAAEDLLAGFIFLVVEVVLISVFLGRIVEWQREKRWRKARSLLGRRLCDLDEEFDLWWSTFTRSALDPSVYDGVVRTPSIFAAFDNLIVRFGFLMNEEIAIAYSDYRYELQRFETLYRKLSIGHGGNTVGNIIRYAGDIRGDGTVSFEALTGSLVAVLNVLGYEPEGQWWQPEEFMEGRPGPKSAIEFR